MAIGNSLAAGYKYGLLTDDTTVNHSLATASKISVIISTGEISSAELYDETNQFMVDYTLTGVTTTGTDAPGAWANGTTAYEVNNLSATLTTSASTGKTTFDLATDPTFSSVNTSGATIKSITIWREVTNASDSPLIAYIDTATGLPLDDPGTADVTVVWDNGTAKIFLF